MNDLDKILEFLAANKSRLRKQYHLTKIGVFGSLAQNEQDEHSDIDLIVEFENNTQDLYSLKRAMKEEIEKRFGRSVDICREKYIKPHFKEKIRSEARYV